MKDLKKEEHIIKKSFELNAEDIKNYLISLGKIKKEDKIKVQFRVPGGGDWSNCLIDVCDDDPIVVDLEAKVTYG